ncbi:MAG: hypothetical protein ACD_60C00102G0002 [uncultured bacterium]|nr:MAG: hypothetical protein ACD_60C00102G0002 [uncultured bacterium]
MADEKLILQVLQSAYSRIEEIADQHNERVVNDILRGNQNFSVTKWRIAEVMCSDAFMRSVLVVAENWAAGAIERKTGLVLEHGLSEESVARAIGKRAGFVLRSLHDLAIIEADLLAVVTRRIERQMRWRFEGVINSADEFLRELERKAASEIASRVPGLVLHDLTDIARVKDDLLRFAERKIKERTGLDFRDIADQQKCREDMIRFADAEVRRRLRIDGTAVGGGLKMTRKAIRNRTAQRRFYEAHGNLKIYERVT